MATVFELLDTIVEEVKTLTQNLVPLPLVFVDAPNTTLLANLARGASPWFISVFDLPEMARDVTKWGRYSLTPIVTDPTITSDVSTTILTVGGTGTITIGNVPALSDAISAVVAVGIRALGVAVTAGVAETATTLATKLAAAINSTTSLNPYFTATSLANVVTCTNVAAFPLKFASYVGNNGSVITELGRTARGIQISAFTRTQAERSTIGNLILGQVYNWQSTFGFEMPDGTWARILYKGDRPCMDTHIGDIYRWDFAIEAETGVTTQDVLYSVLVPTFIKTAGIDYTSP